MGLAACACSVYDPEIIDYRPAPKKDAGAVDGSGGKSGGGGTGGVAVDAGPDAAVDAGTDAAGCRPNPNKLDEVCTAICPETCNGMDDDCDLHIDEGEAGDECQSPNTSASCKKGSCVITACDGAYFDCNESAKDGCETSLDSLSSCGDCGAVCDIDHATEACIDGACLAIACDPGFGDCDASRDNGCETMVDSVTKCGGCNVACDLANAVPACVDFACAVSSCAPGYADCDGEAANGCEAALDSLATCGACNTPCELAGCAGRVCSTIACAAPTADCDADELNGCEASLLTTVADCGFCGNDCGALPNVLTAACADGVCGIGTCDVGWADCDGLVENGCEGDGTDADADGFPACNDACPADPAKQDTGLCGCGAVDSNVDTDGDAALDCNDGCPLDAGFTSKCARKRLTIDPAQVAASLANFPVMVRITDPKFSAARIDGADLFFSSDGGATPLDFEIERWVQSTGELVAWVRLPLVADLTNTVFYLRYGDGSTIDRQNPTGVWSAAYKAVWHLGNVSSLTDSKGGNTGTNSGATNTSGLIGAAAAFNGTNQNIDLPAAALTGITNPVTFSLWAYGDVAGQPKATSVFEAATSTPARVYNVHLPWSDQIVYWDAGLGASNNRLQKLATAAETEGSWAYWVFTMNGTTGTQRIYRNGAAWATPETDTNVAFSGAAVTTFKLGSDTGGTGWPGTVDEFRVSNVERSAAWIAAEYNNQKTGTTFFAIVDE